ncbi:MAG: Hpt domain-containing protein [Pseudomonadales bacterium]|nr:Hpt domain-containing protein [Pseudomonadales bacterium]
MNTEVERLFRERHTLKGHGGTLGFMAFADILGQAESCLDELRKKSSINID